jgi:hypothetical protein
MKALKIFYIVSCILFSIFSIALLGGSGHQIIYLKNPENVFFISFSLVMALIAVIGITSFLNSKVLNTKPFLVILLVGIIFQIIVFLKFLNVKPSVDVEPSFFLIWLGTLIVFAGAFIIKKLKATYYR